MDEQAIDSGQKMRYGFGEMGTNQEQDNGGEMRGEVDTSAPFESVKEAVTRFGGVGFWKPQFHSSKDESEQVFDPAKAEEEAKKLANDLVVKERETLEVLKELEATKMNLEELKVKLQKESDQSVGNEIEPNSPRESSMSLPSSAPGFILMELKQAKLNLSRTTNDLAEIRATVETYNKKIEKERFELEKTRQRLSSLNASNTVSPLEVDLPRELHRLTSETEQFKKIGEVAKSEVVRATNQIKQTKRKMKTAEIRLVAARKLKEAARASEAVALSELKSLSKSQTLSEGQGITLSFEEYTSLKLKALEAEEASNRRVNEAKVHIDEAMITKTEILNRVEEATEEVKNSKRILEEALSKAEAANIVKLKAEEALRKWRSDHGQRRKSIIGHNSTKFKNSSCRTNTNTNTNTITNTRLFDVNGTHLEGNNVSGPVLRPTMSIGEILSRKLLLTEEYTEKSSMRRKVSLGQMLSKPSNGGGDNGGKRWSGKRKKFGLGRISFLVAKPSKKKKKKKHTGVSCGMD